MEAKIPIDCISNLDNDNKKYLDLIKCCFCGGIFYEPIFVKIDCYIICRNCFFVKFKINQSAVKKKDLDKLFNNVDIKKYDAFLKFKYFCPLCKLNKTNNIEYQYSELINHLKICGNQIIFKELCRCTNILKIYLKDMDFEENKHNILIENKILEKEIEKEKLTLDNKKFKQFLDSEKKEKEKQIINEYLKKHINKKFIGKKRNSDNKNND